MITPTPTKEDVRTSHSAYYIDGHIVRGRR